MAEPSYLKKRIQCCWTMVQYKKGANGGSNNINTNSLLFCGRDGSCSCARVMWNVLPVTNLGCNDYVDISCHPYTSHHCIEVLATRSEQCWVYTFRKLQTAHGDTHVKGWRFAHPYNVMSIFPRIPPVLIPLALILFLSRALSQNDEGYPSL